MKKTIYLLFCIGISILVLLNIDTLSTFLADFLENEKKVYIGTPNEYYRDYDFKYVQQSKDYIPYSYQGLLNIIYSTLNNGWNTFTFYCPDEYENCLNDVNEISDSNNKTLSTINNFVHPYNSYSKIGIVTMNNGEVTINVTKLYSKEDIKRIDAGLDEIITSQTTNDMTTDEKVLKLHDYIINNTKYDKNKTNPESLTALGPLFKGTAVCSGYTDLMSLILYKYGYKNYRVASTTHIWNALLINGEWLHIDLTWDDPITINSDIDTLQHDFYLINTTKLHEFDINDHIFDTTIYQEL